MQNKDLRQRALLAAARATSAGLRQETIADAVGVSQSQVSRVLSGESRRASKVYVRVCEYVESFPGPKRIQTATPQMTEALARLWDGTTEHAEILVALLNTMSALAAYQQGRRRKVDAAP